MEFEVLGPVHIRADGQTRAPSGQLQRTLLSLLLVRPNERHSANRLAAALWGDAYDDRASAKLQVHIHRVRRLFSDPDRITYTDGGYRLEVRPGELDAERFETLVNEVAEVRPHDPHRALELATKAQGLWRGPPFGGLDCIELASETRRLDDLRLESLEDRYAAELATGKHGTTISGLTDLSRQYPLRERFCALLMTALYLSGRQADALQTYRVTRDALVNELGLDPGPELRELEQQILSGERLDLSGAPLCLTVPGPANHSAELATTPPAQLPANITGFVGRDAQIGQLDVLIDQPEGSARIALITGTAGSGKTALAVDWAHRVKQQFHDGQLYVDLHGYGPVEKRCPADVLDGFLRALGMPSEAIPRAVEERAAKFRSLLDGRRMLILLDNAAEVDQVRPLLPGSGTTLAVITARDRLAGLTTRDGATPIELDRLSNSEAHELLVRLLGDRVDDDPESIAQLIRQCAQLPLAIRVAAERIRTLQRSSLPQLVAELTDEQTRLDLLDAGGDPYASMRTVFSWSFNYLDHDSARTFQLYGLHPGNEVDLRAVAALAGSNQIRTVRGHLDVLSRAHLIEEVAQGRYQMHDLLRSYAAELAREDADTDHHAALERLFDYYVRVTSEAMSKVSPAEVDPPDAGGSDGPVIPRLDSYEQAFDWLEKERWNLIAVAESAVKHRAPQTTITIATLIRRYLDISLYVDDAFRLHQAALAAAREHHDRESEGIALYCVGLAFQRSGDPAQAEHHFTAALAILEEVGADEWRAATLNRLAGVYHTAGKTDTTIDLLHQALDLYRAQNHPLQLRPLSNLGLVHLGRGDYELAADYAEQSLRLAQEIDDRASIAYSHFTLAELYEVTGRLDDAATHAHSATDHVHRSGARTMEAPAFQVLAKIAHRRGAYAEARRYWGEALRSLTSVNPAEESRLQALNGLGEATMGLGELPEAMEQFGTALEASSRIGHRHEQARANVGLGDAHHQLGNGDEAVAHWERALVIYRDIQARQAAEVETRLNRPRPASH